jgi:hypothetical protein
MRDDPLFQSVCGVLANEPFYLAIFNYRKPFAVMYESGIDRVPRFDAHLAGYAAILRKENRQHAVQHAIYQKP